MSLQVESHLSIFSLKLYDQVVKSLLFHGAKLANSSIVDRCCSIRGARELAPDAIMIQ